MKHPEQVILVCLVLAATAVIGQTTSTGQNQPSKNSPQSASPAGTDRGQEVFNQNCSRCHQTPEGFPPSVSGTIAKHMRVRAGLSGEDYKALLKFLNP
jgi:cytochrome c5